MHVALVFTTGALRNLNHMYAGRNDHSWVGFWFFAASMVVVDRRLGRRHAVHLRHPRVMQRVGYALIGPAQRLFEHVDPKPGQYTEADISPYFWHNGQVPGLRRVQARCSTATSSTTGCAINGLVDNPVELDLAQLRALPAPRADHPALLHPGLVGRRQMGRRVHADHPGPGPALARGEVGGLLLPR